MKNVLKIVNKNKKKPLERISQEEAHLNEWKDADGKFIDSQQLLISMLLPCSVKYFFKELENEVKTLCGNRGEHDGEYHRWGSQAGSIFLGNQKVAIDKPRVRNKENKKERELELYKKLQDPSIFDEQIFKEGIRKVSQRDYESAIPKISSSFGFSKSSVSRRWIRATKKELEKLQTRDLSGFGITAIFLDGKRFGPKGTMIALGLGSDEKKHVLGTYEASSENSKSCIELLNDLESRGLPKEGLLFIVDGGSGLNKALNEKYDIDDKEKRRAIRIRCYKHKKENILSSLKDDEQEQAGFLLEEMRTAHSYQEAKFSCDKLEKYLKEKNLSAHKSLLEAKDDLMMLHQLDLNSQLRKFFSTTNPIESLNYLFEEDLRRVKRWKNSEQFHRWVAASALRNEKRMRRPSGSSGIKKLKIKLNELCRINVDLEQKVA